MPFIFRAQAALDLRRRREESAQRARSEAAAALERAELSVREAEAELARTIDEGAGVFDPGERMWYRNWIVRQRQEIVRRRQMAADRRAAHDAALMRVHAAHKDVRALERLSDRTKVAWATVERRREQKDLDWLGCVRFQQQRAAARKEDR